MLTFRGLNKRQIIIGSAAIAMLIGLGVFGFSRLSTQPMAMLYQDLPMEDSAVIVEKLESMKVPFELENNGSRILVPKDKVLRLRIQLAVENLPTGGVKGYEIFDQSESLGMTDFLQNVNFIRALEGELSRTIRELKPVKSARVHLVIPKKRTFFREKPKTTASVLLHLSSPITRKEISAIRQLVSRAVEGLSPEMVTIADQKGRLWAGQNEHNFMDESDRELEFTKAIINLLESSVGVGNVRASVQVETENDEVSESYETFDPQSRALKSTKVTEQKEKESGSEAGSKSDLLRKEEVTNYEISKTVKTVKRQVGSIKRISIAVMVNGTYQKDGDKTAYKPRTQDEMDSYRALIESAVGFDKARGDTIQIVNMPFVYEEFTSEEEIEEESTVFGFPTQSIIQTAELALVFIGGSLLLIFFILPIIKTLIQSFAKSQPKDEGPLPEIDTKAMAAPQEATLEQDPTTPPSEKIANLVEKNKEATVSVVRNWIHAEE